MTTTITVILVPRGVRKRAVPAISVDTTLMLREKLECHKCQNWQTVNVIFTSFIAVLRHQAIGDPLEMCIQKRAQKTSEVENEKRSRNANLHLEDLLVSWKSTQGEATSLLRVANKLDNYKRTLICNEKLDLLQKMLH